MYRNIDWDAITIKNNFLFQETLRNKSLCKQLLERVLHIQVKTIRYMEAEKTMKAQLNSKNIRLDVYLETLDGTVIDLEMQVTGKGCGQDGGQGAGGVFALCGQRPGGKPVHAGAG